METALCYGLNAIDNRCITFWERGKSFLESSAIIEREISRAVPATFVTGTHSAPVTRKVCVSYPYNSAHTRNKTTAGGGAKFSQLRL